MGSVRYRLLAPIHPVPDRDAWLSLDRVGARLGHAVVRAVRDKSLSFQAQLDFNEAVGALERVFGCSDNLGHCFHVDPHDWLSLIETQVTRGLASFMSGATYDEARVARIAALFRVCAGGGEAGDVRVDEVIAANVIAEQRLSDDTRPDLVALLRMADGSDRLLLIEAKLNHEIGQGQLKAYEQGICEIQKEHALRCSPEQVQLVLIGRDLRASDAKQLRAHPRWRFLSWRDLVLGFERHLHSGDDKDFRRFRRTLWEQCA